MITAWTKHLKDPEEKVKLEKSLKHSRWVLDNLSEILNELERDLNSSELNSKSYDSPNWDYRQADNIGYRRCLNTVRKIINLDQKET